MLAEGSQLRGLGGFGPSPARGEDEAGHGVVVNGDKVELGLVRAALPVRKIK